MAGVRIQMRLGSLSALIFAAVWLPTHFLVFAGEVVCTGTLICGISAGLTRRLCCQGYLLCSAMPGWASPPDTLTAQSVPPGGSWKKAPRFRSLCPASGQLFPPCHHNAQSSIQIPSPVSLPPARNRVSASLLIPAQLQVPGALVISLLCCATP